MERPSPRRSLNFSRLVSNKRPDTVDVRRHLQKISLQRQVHQMEASFSSHYFSALGSIWHQIRGAGIGSQISPTISNLAVTMVERAWQHLFEALLSQKPLNFSSVRYVDNRFAVFDSVIAKSDPIVIYSDPILFGHPVELEKVDDSMLLGFHVSQSTANSRYYISWVYPSQAERLEKPSSPD